MEDICLLSKLQCRDTTATVTSILLWILVLAVVSFTRERHQAEAINGCFGVLSAVVTSGVNLSPNSTQTRSRCLWLFFESLFWPIRESVSVCRLMCLQLFLVKASVSFQMNSRWKSLKTAWLLNYTSVVLDPQSLLQLWLFHRTVAPPGGQLVICTRALMGLGHAHMSRWITDGTVGNWYQNHQI